MSLKNVLKATSKEQAMKIIGVYKITNTVTGDFYIGSSIDVKERWKSHQRLSVWKKCPNNPMYLDMQKYGVDKFDFQILEEVEIDSLKEAEQQFIELLKPTYNNRRANGLDFERHKESNRKANRKYQKSTKRKEYMKEYKKSDKYKECNKKYQNQLCLYNGEIIKLNTLATRFYRAGVEHCTLEAKKYLLNNNPIEFYDVYP